MKQTLDTLSSGAQPAQVHARFWQGFSPSIKAYLALVVVLAVLSATAIFLPQGDLPSTAPAQTLPAAGWVTALIIAGIMFVLYGGLGLIGVFLSRKLGFPEIIDARVSSRQRYLIPVVAGIGVGVFFIIADALISRFHAYGPIPHPPFPTSIVASATAGIGEEILFRLFFISFWTWLISKVILRGRFQAPVFWVVTTFSALAFSAAHIPAATVLLGIEMGQIQLIPAPILFELFLLNGLISFLAAAYFRKYGFLAAVGIHFWADVVWHVVWGLV